MGTVRGHLRASNPSAWQQEQPKFREEKGSAPALRHSQEFTLSSNLHPPGYISGSLCLFLVLCGTSFCAVNNRDVVKLKHVAICLAAFSSGGIVQLCSLSSESFSLGPILPLQLSKPPSGSQTPGFVVSVCWPAMSAGQQHIKGGNGKWAIHITKKVSWGGMNHSQKGSSVKTFKTHTPQTV